jgi:hypothetical protein
MLRLASEAVEGMNIVWTDHLRTESLVVIGIIYEPRITFNRPFSIARVINPKSAHLTPVPQLNTITRLGERAWERPMFDKASARPLLYRDYVCYRQ